MESITKYRVILLKDYEDNSMAVNYLEWAKNDSLLDDQKEETPNAKVDIFKENGDLLFIYTNLVQSDNPLESEQVEFVDQYISYALKEASSMNTECYMIDNTTGRHQEQLLFNAMDTNMKSHYVTVWRAVGKTVEQINELKQVYTSTASTEPKKVDMFEEPIKNEGESFKPIVTKEEPVIESVEKELSDRELIVSLLHKVDQLQISVNSLTSTVSELTEKLQSSTVKDEGQTTEVKETEPKKLTEEDLLDVRNYSIDVEKEKTSEIENTTPDESNTTDKDEGIPAVDETKEANDNIGNAGVTGIYQNAVFYPKNPVKNDDPPQVSQTDTEILTGELPKETEKEPVSTSKGNESNEETVIYNSVDKTETLWEGILSQASTESELSTLIVDNYNELPKSIQDDFLRFNMYDKYKSGKTTTLTKVEAVKRKVKVKKI